MVKTPDMKPSSPLIRILHEAHILIRTFDQGSLCRAPDRVQLRKADQKPSVDSQLRGGEANYRGLLLVGVVS